MGFADAVRDRVLLFDGAMGTQIQKYDPKRDDFPSGHDGFNDGLNITHPEWISEIHKSYLEAGSDCIETNSFGSNQIKLDEYGYGEQTVRHNRLAASLARKEADRYGDRYVIGTMGPTGFLPSSNDADLGQLPLEKIRTAFELQARGLIEGGADAILIETSQDILEVKLAITACHNVDGGAKIPIIANVTLDQYGKMLLGTDVAAAYTTVSDMGIFMFGLNCSTGPVEMTPSVRWLGEQNLDILVVPNAGMPENQNGRAIYRMTPREMADALGSFVRQYGRIRVIGGCCGTTPDHIRELRRVLDGGTG